LFVQAETPGEVLLCPKRSNAKVLEGSFTLTISETHNGLSSSSPEGQKACCENRGRLALLPEGLDNKPESLLFFKLGERFRYEAASGSLEVLFARSLSQTGIILGK